jgi:hypothetical protein
VYVNKLMLFAISSWIVFEKDLEKWHNISSGQKDRAHAKLKSQSQLHTIPLACAAWNNMLFLQKFLFYVPFIDV